MKPLAAIVCDDVREEWNKKEMLIGVYGNDMLINKLPTSLRLAVHVLVEMEGEGMVPFEVEMEAPDHSNKTKVGGAIEILAPTKMHQQVGLSLPGFVIKISEGGELIIRMRQHEGEWETIKSLPVKVAAQQETNDSLAAADVTDPLS